MQCFVNGCCMGMGGESGLEGGVVNKKEVVLKVVL